MRIVSVKSGREAMVSDLTKSQQLLSGPKSADEDLRRIAAVSGYTVGNHFGVTGSLGAGATIMEFLHSLVPVVRSGRTELSGHRTTRGKLMKNECARIVALRKSCATKPHGQRARYIAGCRCLPCRASHARYNAECERRAKSSITNKIVPADRAREHLLHLSARGVGRRAVHAATDIAESILQEIAKGRRLRIRQETKRRILAVDESARSDHSLVDAAPSWKLLGELIASGYTRTQLARWLGCKSKRPALQLSRSRLLACHAVRIQQLYARVQAGFLRRDTPVKLRKGS